jgi:uncharacterized surface protein with fasciclin (FAS1) repeats
MKIRLLSLPACAALLLTTFRVAAQAGPISPDIPADRVAPDPIAYQTLMHAFQATELQEILENRGPFTVFAPSDAAFEKMESDGMGELLKPENRNDLRAVLAYHIVAGELTASRILRALCRGEGAARFTTVQGEELLATLEGSDIILTDCSGNRARIVNADFGRKNLVFHEIDAVILPKPL